MTLNNLSDGKSDGLVLFYAKDGTLYPIGLSEEQAQAIDLTIGLGLNVPLHVMFDKPMGELDTLKE